MTTDIEHPEVRKSRGTPRFARGDKKSRLGATKKARGEKKELGAAKKTALGDTWGLAQIFKTASFSLGMLIEKGKPPLARPYLPWFTKMGNILSN